MKEEKFELGGYKLRLFLYRKRWAIEIKKGKARKIKSLKTKDHEMAIDEFYKYKLELKEKGRLNIIFDTDLFRQIEIFLEWSKTNSVSPRTYEKHNETMKKFITFIKKKRTEKITPIMYEEYKNYLLAKGLAPRTVDLHLTTLGKMVGVLEDLEIVPKGINSKPKLIRPKKVTAPKFWTSEEVERILKAAKGSYIYNMLVVALNLGLRQNEIRYLRWDDINLDKGFLVIQSHPEDGFNPKDYELRRIKLNKEVTKVLRELKSKSRPNIKHVFTNKYGVVRKNNLYRDLLRVLKKAEVDYKGAWHCARRTWGSHAIMAGADPKSVQKIYGHSRLETTQAYLNVTDRHLDKTMDLVGFSYSEEKGKVITFPNFLDSRKKSS